MPMNEKENKSLPSIEEVGSKEKQSFEESLRELEGLIKALEGGQLTLEEAIGAYERGFALRESCWNKLQGAKAKIETLMVEKPLP